MQKTDNLNMPCCFISHTWHKSQHHFAVRLANALKERKIRVWIDENEIMPSCSIKEIIAKGIRHESDAFVFVLSPEALKSKMCKYELNLALTQMEEAGKAIIPVFYNKCSIPKFLKNICYADFRDPLYFNAALERLEKAFSLPGRFGRIVKN